MISCRGMCLSLLAAMLAVAVPTHGSPLMKITVSAPGPRNLSYLPIDLIKKIGADRAEGADITVLNTGGGGVALKNLSTRNCDFAVAGMPAVMSHRASGKDVVTIAAVDQDPLFVLMVRADLRNRVRTAADLRGHVIGVNASTLTTKTTSQQLAELLLKHAGVPADQVRIVSAGQSWGEQSSILASKSADAVMGDEPFASRLLAEKKVFFLANLGNPTLSPKIPGAGFLHAAVSTRSDILEKEPHKVAAMHRILRRTLQWMASRPAAEILDRLDIRDPSERAALAYCLKAYPRAFSTDGAFSTRQLRETEDFFYATSANPATRLLRIESMIDDRWAGRKP